MPIKIPATLPAREILEGERVPLILEERALHQDIRPLRIALLNLMPNKIPTETQFMRVLGATPLQIEMTLLRTATYESKNTSAEHLTTFYKTWEDVKNERFDALIVTGAPVEHLEYDDVNYWPELRAIFDWADTNVYSTFFVCWGAQAALYHHHGVRKHKTPAKKFGVFPHRILKPFHPLIAGFDDDFPVPVARNTEVRHEDVAHLTNLDILAESDETGLCLAFDEAKRRVYMFNHLEYDADTLSFEYFRDKASGFGDTFPQNYFPDDDDTKAPRITWRAHRTLFFANWINMVYQGTPYNLDEL
ncbi:MAG: homoserine O-succinyltransferase [Alphaproteobacteria bacterium]|nr:homoserine O-succinyltransferase [Alphaproteobacteria bacterium]